MKYLFLNLFVSILYSCSSQPGAQQNIEFKSQWDNLRALRNPHKGWYHHLLDNGVDGY